VSGKRLLLFVKIETLNFLQIAGGTSWENTNVMKLQMQRGAELNLCCHRTQGAGGDGKK
jgi:hypothetical protein